MLKSTQICWDQITYDSRSIVHSKSFPHTHLPLEFIYNSPSSFLLPQRRKGNRREVSCGIPSALSYHDTTPVTPYKHPLLLLFFCVCTTISERRNNKKAVRAASLTTIDDGDRLRFLSFANDRRKVDSLSPSLILSHRSEFPNHPSQKIDNIVLLLLPFVCCCRWQSK